MWGGDGGGKGKTAGGPWPASVFGGKGGNKTAPMKRPAEDWDGPPPKAPRREAPVAEPAAGGAAGGAAADVVLALVKQTIPEQGYSLVTMDPSNEESNMRLDASQVPPSLLSQAQAIAFTPKFGASGEIEPSPPFWLLRGKVDPAVPVTWPPYAGRVDRVTMSGDAFIDCPGVKQKYGRDAYCYRKVKRMCDLIEGDEIQFDIHLNAQNQPQLPGPIWKKLTPGQVTDDASSGEMSLAFVKKTCPDKGFSFLTTDPTDESNQIYVHHTVASPSALDGVQAVAFRSHLSPKGEMQAQKPIWLLSGKVDTSNPVKWGDYTGTVSNINAAGDAYIDCPAVKEQYGRDAYVFRKVKRACGLEIGDTIQFNVHLNSQQMPQVEAPVFKKHDERAYQSQGMNHVWGLMEMMMGCKGGGKFGGKKGGKGFKGDGGKGIKGSGGSGEIGGGEIGGGGGKGGGFLGLGGAGGCGTGGGKGMDFNLA